MLKCCSATFLQEQEYELQFRYKKQTSELEILLEKINFVPEQPVPRFQAP